MNNCGVNDNNMNPSGTTRNRRRVSSNETTTKAGTVETVTLPPCRICGANASGFHYGVNSCEACKGFFRRALKRPAMFCCSKNGTCDVMGNKRSSCRFCRYKLCLRLGMSRESIKTGRYSHKKRTRDTIEVKRLQSSPNSIARNTELDILVKNLLETHDSLAISSSHIPHHFYRRQLEYFKGYLLNKKTSNNSCANFRTKDIPVFGDHEFKHSGQDKDNCEPRDHIKLSSPSPTSSRLSSDSGFIEENNEAMSNNNNSPALISDVCEYVEFIDSNKDSSRNKTGIILNNSGFDIQMPNKSEPCLCSVDSTQNWRLKYEYFLHSDIQTGKGQENSPKTCSLESCCGDLELHEESKDTVCGRAKLSDFNICLGTTGNTRASECHMEQILTCDTNNQSDELRQRNCAFTICSVHTDSKYAKKASNLERTSLSDNSELKTREKYENLTSNLSHFQQTISHPAGFRDGNKSAQENQEHILQAMSSRIQFSSAESISSCCESVSKSGFNSSTNTIMECTLDNFRHIPRNEYMFCKEASYKAHQESDISLNSSQTSGRKSFSSVRAVTKFAEIQDNDELAKYLDQRKESKYANILRAHDWINGYIKFAKAIPGFRSLPVEDQKQLLKHAWDEVWLLSTYKNYNSELCVVATPGGKCFHLDELESVLGKRYSETAFKISDVLKGQNLSHELVTLLKAVCIVSPDRCPLNNQIAVEEIHWTMVSCLMRLIETSTPFSHMMFPRLVLILTSLRDLSESARSVSESDCSGGSVLDCDVLFELLPF